MGMCGLYLLDQRAYLGFEQCRFFSKQNEMRRLMLLKSYGVFLAHYLANNVYPGATYLEFAFIGGLSISQAMFVSPIATSTTRLFSTRTTLLIGVFFETLALIGASFAKEIWQLFLSQGVCFGWGMGFLFVGSVGVTPQWFTTRRSLANAIASAGSGIGGLIYSLAANAIIERISIGWAFRILGILAFAVNTICACLIKDRNRQIGSSQLAFDYKMFKQVEFLLLLGWGFFSMLGYIVVLFSLPNYATSIGLTQKQGSVVGAILNLGQGLGRAPIGYFSDSIGRLNMATAMTFLSGLLVLVVWIFAKSYGVLLFYSLVGGAVIGTFWATVGPVTAEVMGLRRVPAALSIIWVCIVLPTTFSEPIALEIRSFDRNYLGTQLFSGFMYIAAAICGWLLRTWKISEIERTAWEKEDRSDNIDMVNSVPTGDMIGRAKRPSSNFVKSLLMWKKV